MGEEISKVIEEIANQLGLATDQVAKYATQIFPMYAQSLAAEKIAIAVMAFVASMVLTIVTYKLFKIEHKDEALNWTIMAVAILAMLSLGALIISIPTAVSSIVSPEGTAIKEIMRIAMQ